MRPTFSSPGRRKPRSCFPGPDATPGNASDTAPVDDPWRAATQLAQRVCALGPRIVVIKLGSLGALALADGTVSTHPIVPIEPVDPVGAGDAFVGAFLAEFADRNPIDTCLASGAKMGALVCAVPGDWEGIPGLEHRFHRRLPKTCVDDGPIHLCLVHQAMLDNPRNAWQTGHTPPNTERKTPT